MCGTGPALVTSCSPQLMKSRTANSLFLSDISLEKHIDVLVIGNIRLLKCSSSLFSLHFYFHFVIWFSYDHGEHSARIGPSYLSAPWDRLHDTHKPPPPFFSCMGLPLKYINWRRDTSLFKIQTLPGSVLIYEFIISFLKCLLSVHHFQYISCFIKFYFSLGKSVGFLISAF